MTPSPPITAHRGDGQDAEDDQPRPAVVEDVVERVGPQLRGRELHPASALALPGLHGHHLRLEELGDVEEDGERGDGRAVLDQPPEINKKNMCNIKHIQTIFERTKKIFANV